MALKGVWLEIAIPRFSGFWPDMAPATPGPDPDFDFLGAFPKVSKRFWPLRLPIGLRFDSFTITRRRLTVSGDGLALKRPMARDRNPAIFWIWAPPIMALLYPYSPGVGPAAWAQPLDLLVYPSMPGHCRKSPSLGFPRGYHNQRASLGS